MCWLTETDRHSADDIQTQIVSFLFLGGWGFFWRGVFCLVGGVCFLISFHFNLKSPVNITVLFQKSVYAFSKQAYDRLLTVKRCVALSEANIY